MKNFDWEHFINGGFAVNCKTKEATNEFLGECDKRGIVISHKLVEGGENYMIWGEVTCYRSGILDYDVKLFYGDVDYYTGRNYKIVEWQSSNNVMNFFDVVANLKEGETYQGAGGNCISYKEGKITIATDTHSISFHQSEAFKKLNEVDFTTAIEHMKNGVVATCLYSNCGYTISDGKLKGIVTGLEMSLTLNHIESKWLIEE